MKPTILVTAPVTTRSGYGNHSRDLCRALIESDKYDVKINAVPWGNTPMNALNENNPNDKMITDRLLQNPQLPKQPDLHIHIVIPNEFNPVGKYNIGITAGLEMTVCPPAWIEGMNRMDLNLVSSQHSKNVALQTHFELKDNQGQVTSKGKLEKPCEVLFEGLDLDKYYKKPSKSDILKDIHEDFCFFIVYIK